MNDRLLSFLGICRRAKKLVIGAQVAAESAEQGRSCLILYSSDGSQNSLKPVLAAAKQKGVEVMCAGRTKEELSSALGRLCNVLSVEDRGFADRLKEIIGTEQGGEFDEKIQG